jgi:hypothetical protein
MSEDATHSESADSSRYFLSPQLHTAQSEGGFSRTVDASAGEVTDLRVVTERALQMAFPFGNCSLTHATHADPAGMAAHSAFRRLLFKRVVARVGGGDRSLQLSYELRSSCVPS